MKLSLLIIALVNLNSASVSNEVKIPLVELQSMFRLFFYNNAMSIAFLSHLLQNLLVQFKEDEEMLKLS